MKNLVIFMTSIFALLLFAFLSCNKNEQLEGPAENKTTNENSEVIDSNTVWIDGTLQDRAVDSCAQCLAQTDCCCGIELLAVPLPNNSASIDLCGTFDGGGSCSVSSGECTTYDGGQSATLNFTSDPKVLFCMENDSVVCIKNTETYAIQIFFSCQYGQTNPDNVTPTIPAGRTFCYTVNDQCEINLCN